MSKEEVVKAGLSGGYTLVIPVPKELRSDSAYEAIGIGPGDDVKIETFGSSLKLTKVVK